MLGGGRGEECSAESLCCHTACGVRGAGGVEARGGGEECVDTRLIWDILCADWSCHPAPLVNMRLALLCMAAIFGGFAFCVACALMPACSRFSCFVGIFLQYDLYTTSYSPDGRVFQVEYAAKAVETSGTAVVNENYSTTCTSLRIDTPELN